MNFEPDNARAEVLRQRSMPIALLRLGLGDTPLSPDMSLDWNFYGELE